MDWLAGGLLWVIDLRRRIYDKIRPCLVCILCSLFYEPGRGNPKFLGEPNGTWVMMTSKIPRLAGGLPAVSRGVWWGNGSNLKQRFLGVQLRLQMGWDGNSHGYGLGRVDAVMPLDSSCLYKSSSWWLAVRYIICIIYICVCVCWCENAKMRSNPGNYCALFSPKQTPPLVLKMPTISAGQKLGASPDLTVNFLIQSHLVTHHVPSSWWNFRELLLLVHGRPQLKWRMRFR